MAGTVLGQAQFRQHGLAMPPEFTRSAAILAAVQDAAQRARLKQATESQLRSRGLPDDLIATQFSPAHEDAVAGHRAANMTRDIPGAVTGGVMGLAVTGDARAPAGAIAGWIISVHMRSRHMVQPLMPAGIFARSGVSTRTGSAPVVWFTSQMAGAVCDDRTTTADCVHD